MQQYSFEFILRESEKDHWCYVFSLILSSSSSVSEMARGVGFGKIGFQNQNAGMFLFHFTVMVSCLSSKNLQTYGVIASGP